MKKRDMFTERRQREASTLIFKIRSCTATSDLKNKAFSVLNFAYFLKIRSSSARSDLINKSARFSGRRQGISCMKVLVGVLVHE